MIELADLLRILIALAWVVLFFAAMRSCGALERIADELTRANNARQAGDAGVTP